MSTLRVLNFPYRLGFGIPCDNFVVLFFILSTFLQFMLAQLSHFGIVLGVFLRILVISTGLFVAFDFNGSFDINIVSWLKIVKD